MNRVRLNLGLIFLQEVENIVTFQRSACGKTAHEGDVVVRNQVVADAAIAAVADVVFGHQRLWIQIPLHAIGRSRLSKSPEPLEWEPDVGVYDDGDCLIQTGFCNVPLIDEGEFESIQILNRAGPFASDLKYIRNRTRLKHIVPAR